MRPVKMAPAGGAGAVRGLWVPLAVLALALVRAALALTEQYPALSLLQQELHRQRQGPAGGCASAGEWAEPYSAECGESGGGEEAVKRGAPRYRGALRPRAWCWCWWWWWWWGAPGRACPPPFPSPRPAGGRRGQKRKARPGLASL